MRILIIRHGDPDYKNDSLTPDGMIEAEYLAETLASESIDEIFVSPLGRAQKTAEFTLSKKKMQGTTLPWLREFSYPIAVPDGARAADGHSIFWDFYPSFYDKEPRLFDFDHWQEVDFVKNSDLPYYYRMVTEGIDGILSKYGYERNGLSYRATDPNKKTIALFCHFGVESIILSHLCNIAPFAILQQFCGLPTSVTTLVTEERQEGIAHFRCLCFGSTEHLYLHGRKPSFAARYCETFDSPERH